MDGDANRRGSAGGDASRTGSCGWLTLGEGHECWGRGLNAASSGWFGGGEQLGYSRADRQVSTIHEKKKKRLTGATTPTTGHWCWSTAALTCDGIWLCCAGEGLGRGFWPITAGISPCFVKKYLKTFNEKILYFTKINAGKHIIFSFQ